MKKNIFIFSLFLCSSAIITAQQVALTSEQIKAYTPNWKGNRSADGRLQVLDRIW